MNSVDCLRSSTAHLKAWSLSILSMILLFGLSSTLWGEGVNSIKERSTGIDRPSGAGLAIGERLPDFRAKDQEGKLQDFNSIRGPKGAIIYFHRSAAWCIYCKLQLVQLEKSKETFHRNGLGICTISYDSPEVLRHFAREKKISISLLSDQGSRIIRNFNMLDTNVPPDNPAYGVPLHGTYVVNEAGTVVSKFFEQNVGHSTGIVLTRLFGSPLNTHETLITHDHLSLKYYASSNSASAGDQVNLTIEVLPNDRVHVYAPGVKDYLPIIWDLEASLAFSSQAVDYPSPRIVYLSSIGEKFPVYEKTFRISRRITINPDKYEILKMVDSEGNLAIRGAFRFQACHDKTCYIPRKVPLEWKLQTKVFERGEGQR